MKIKIAIAIQMIILIGLTTAYYPGDTIIIDNDINTTNLVYTIIENSTAINISIEIYNDNLTIKLPLDIKPDSFIIVFIEEQTNEVVKEVRIGGGRTKYIDRNVTVIQPEFYDREVVKEIEVEKIVDHIEYQETGFKLWHIILAVVLGIIFCYILLWVLIYFTGESE